MTIALFFTFCCLGCTAVNDLVFKLFARKDRSRGLFVMSVGVTGTLLLLWLPDKVGDWHQTLLWGLICGIFSAVGNIMLIESMGKLSAGICSTIYRMNLALVVPLSVLFFNETLNMRQYPGIFLALAAVIFFLPGKGQEKFAENRGSSLLIPVILIISASVFRAGLGLSCKYGPMQGASANGISLIIEVVWIISGLVYYLVKERKLYKPEKSTFFYGALSGLLVMGILVFMVQALACEGAYASVVLAIAQMSFLATFILSVIFLKEKVTWRKLAALACGTAALLLLV
jgi:drug/metabolite transporter (DMT)-like permease